MIEGFDSRYWDGIIPARWKDILKFVGIKWTQGKNKVYAEPKLQWSRAKGELLRLPFHFWESPQAWEDPIQNGIAQAEWFFTAGEEHFGGDYGELAPAIDLEGRIALGVSKRNAVLSILSCLKRTDELWGIDAEIYTANWWFYPNIGSHYKPEDYPEYENLYERKLWEADPPPDTPCGGIAGEWTEEEVTIRQYALDVPPSLTGFNAGVDFNSTTQEKLDSITYVQSPVNCQEFKDKIDDLIVKNAQLKSDNNALEDNVERLTNKLITIRDITNS